MNKKKKKENGMLLVYISLIAVIFLVTGYALFSQNLSVSGTATADASFAIVWQTPSITGSFGASGTAAPSLSAGDTILTINPVLDGPGSYVEVTATVKNNGAINAEITGVVPTNPLGTDIIVTYTPTFTVAQTLAAGATTQVVIRVEYDDESSNQGSIEETFGVAVTYTQDT